MTMGINDTARAIEDFVRSYGDGGVTPREVQVRPSGDDVDVIKVWVDLGATPVDPDGWARACEAAIAEAIPSAAAFRVVVRAEPEPR